MHRAAAHRVNWSVQLFFVGRKWGGTIRILSQPVPLAFCFDGLAQVMDAVARAVRTVTVLSSALARIGSRFFLCVTVRFSERLTARGLFSEYGWHIGAGALTAAYIAEHADAFFPDAVARMGRYL